MAEIDEVFVVDCEVRIGVYPGETVVSTHQSHWAACEEMMRRNTQPRVPDGAA